MQLYSDQTGCALQVFTRPGKAVRYFCFDAITQTKRPNVDWYDTERISFIFMPSCFLQFIILLVQLLFCLCLLEISVAVVGL